ncbi:MAG: hypothetical protein RL748_2770 [Pseudomonadota bacterium]|jgi:three-Cys-motif partner protein
MAQLSFVNKGTQQKLRKVSEYAGFYTQALKNKGLHLYYVDVFAGTGEIPMSGNLPLLDDLQDIDDIVIGSAGRSLDIKQPFDKYVFADIKRKNTENLESLRDKYPNLKDRISIKRGEANDTVRDFCNAMQPKDRALLFLDPFGNQVNWKTLELIAQTKKIDLFYLFPAGLGVARQISNQGEYTLESEQSLNRIFGSDEWKTECVKFDETRDLFDDLRVTSTKVVTPTSITRYMINKMGTIFEGGVSERWLPLGRDKRHNYSLLFACSNPDKAARSLAQRVAKDIMTRK